MTSKWEGLRHSEEGPEVISGEILADRNPVGLYPGVGAEGWHPPDPDAPGGPPTAQPAEEDGGQRTG